MSAFAEYRLSLVHSYTTRHMAYSEKELALLQSSSERRGKW